MRIASLTRSVRVQLTPALIALALVWGTLMKSRIFRVMVVCTALFAGSASADGVLFFITGPAVEATDPMWGAFTGSPEVTKIHTVVVNEAAIDSNVITIVIDGKEYRLVGGMVKTTSESVMWGGKEPGDFGASLSVAKGTGGSFGGNIEMIGRRFSLQKFKGTYILVERDPNLFKNPLPYKVPELAADRAILNKGVRK